MSYANYQYVATVMYFRIFLNVNFYLEGRRHWLRSSKTLASWTNAKHGAQKYFTRTPDQNKDCLSHSRPPLIFEGRSAALLTAALCLYLELREDLLFLRWVLPPHCAASNKTRNIDLSMHDMVIGNAKITQITQLLEHHAGDLT